MWRNIKLLFKYNNGKLLKYKNIYDGRKLWYLYNNKYINGNSKYDNLIRLDSDDIMLPNLIEIVIKKTENENIDSIKFLMEDFGRDDKIDWACGQFLIKHWIFDFLVDLFLGFVLLIKNILIKNALILNIKPKIHKLI